MSRSCLFIICILSFHPICFAQEGHAAVPVTFEKIFARGKEIELLEEMVGMWTVRMKLWVRPTAQPIQPAPFQATRRMVGNFLEEVAQAGENKQYRK